MVALAAFLTALPLQTSALPESDAAMGRLIARRFADAVVAIKGTAVVKITMDDRTLPPTEQKFDVNGTIITPAGLTVTSLNAIDPRALFETNRAQMSPGGQKITLGKTEFKGIKLHLGDGTEIPVKIVWKDVDLDLALLLPEGPAGGNGRTFTYVNLNEAPEAARLLGDYFQLSRAAEVLQRVVLLRVSSITGIIERPRRRFLVSTDAFPDTVGCPVFDSQGKVLGINVRLMENGLPKASLVFPSADLAAVIAENAPPE
jgi:S1-C subfamily serine protease